jgi:rhodanese-related sulfurtransferase
MSFPEVTPTQLADELASATPPFVLDVREPWELADGAIAGAVNIPLGELGERANEVPRDRRVVVVCRSGNRSRAATDALDRAGWNAHNLKAGMFAWERSEAA